ncbi:hypothetical protein NBM05_05950 [Rothia sp. AR01]|uniref:Zinc-finger domain-containing protein n=1 Tax=Rothia santali TaxID=2949643 RepID=A0A9X2HEZ5_9MICC|nr:hypothetical protein [Rothia santali]
MNDGAGRHSWADDVHADAALYAVDALDDDEARAFEAHLADCAMCQEEVDSFRGTGAELAGSLPVEPPPELRASVLTAVHEAGRAGVVPEAEDAAAAEAGAEPPRERIVVARRTRSGT